MSEMSDRKTRANDYPVPVPDWWPRAVERELEGRTPPLQKQKLAEAIGLDKWDVSRCLHGQAVLGDVQKISDYLKIPHPVALFETEEMALAFRGFLLLRGLDAQMMHVAQRAPDSQDSLGTPVEEVSQGAQRRRRARSGRTR
jgi:hypothetical protein